MQTSVAAEHFEIQARSGRVGAEGIHRIVDVTRIATVEAAQRSPPIPSVSNFRHPDTPPPSDFRRSGIEHRATLDERGVIHHIAASACYSDVWSEVNRRHCLASVDNLHQSTDSTNIAAHAVDIDFQLDPHPKRPRAATCALNRMSMGIRESPCSPRSFAASGSIPIRVTA